MNNSTSTVDLNSEVGSFLILYAFRYAIGRRTYAVDDINTFLRTHFHQLNPVIGNMIVKEIRSELELNHRMLQSPLLISRDLSSWEQTLKLITDPSFNT